MGKGERRVMAESTDAEMSSAVQSAESTDAEMSSAVQSAESTDAAHPSSRRRR
jgi:hypothetical protein